MRAALTLICLTTLGMPGMAGEPTAAERGKKALETNAYGPPSWPGAAVENAWRQWGVDEKPADYDAAFRERYGLHPAPYPNGGLPMGLRESRMLIAKGVTSDCMICHGGSILGKSYVGLGNSSLDIHALFSDLYTQSGIKDPLPFQFSRVRGTTEAGGMAVYLLGFRNPDLTLRSPRVDLGLRDDLCEDPPAWWLLKKKKTMYHTGSTDTRSVRSIMQFMMSPLNPPAAFHKSEAEFGDILAYIKSIEAPKYPYPIDQGLAEQGRAIFETTCASCHGTYGDKPTYPNKVVELDIIGTDRTRFDGISTEFGEEYNRSWFGQEDTGWFLHGWRIREPVGYQAPPLDGVWATAPYLHNGSVPTVYHLLKSDSRPAVFTRSYRTGAEDYDRVKLGWKFREVDGVDRELPAIDRRKVYDTRQSGRGNRGHTFGDDLSEAERMAVIEYLKTL